MHLKKKTTTKKKQEYPWIICTEELNFTCSICIQKLFYKVFNNVDKYNAIYFFYFFPNTSGGKKKITSEKEGKSKIVTILKKTLTFNHFRTVLNSSCFISTLRTESKRVQALLKAQAYRTKQTDRTIPFWWDWTSGVVFVRFELPCPLLKRCTPAAIESTLINPAQLQVRSQLGVASCLTWSLVQHGASVRAWTREGVTCHVWYVVRSGVTPLPYSP